MGRHFFAAALAVAALAAPASAAGDASAHDVRTLKNAWIVYPRFGTYHLKNGGYESPARNFRISLLARKGMLAVDRTRAAALSMISPARPGRILFLSVFTRTPAGFFRNDATVTIGRGALPLGLTLHGNRLRLSVVQLGGRQDILIYHLSGRGLTAAATRHAQ